MEFGLFYEMPVPYARLELGTYTEKDMYDALLRQVVRAEELGFSIVWLPEHHSNTDYSHISAPEVVLMNLAAHTSTIRFGPAVVVVPVHHPVMVAERYGTLDLLSNGRLELGVGRGAYAGWFRLFTPGKFKDVTETRPIFTESLEVIRKAWTEEWFTHEGEHYQIREPINVIPKPMQKPHPAFHAPCSSPDSLDVYPRLGINAQTQTWVWPLAGVAEQVRRFRESWAAGLGTPGNLATRERGTFSCLINVYCAPTRERALAELKPYWEWFIARLAEFYFSEAARPDLNRQQQSVHVPYVGAGYGDLTFEKAVEQGMICVGSPDDCAEYIGTLQQAGVDVTFGQFHIGPMPHAMSSASLELFGQEVAPSFRAQPVAAG